jgi:hypothetical protein
VSEICVEGDKTQNDEVVEKSLESEVLDLVVHNQVMKMWKNKRSEVEDESEEKMSSRRKERRGGGGKGTHFVHHDSHPPAYFQIPHQNSYTPSNSQSTFSSLFPHIDLVYQGHRVVQGGIESLRGCM